MITVNTRVWFYNNNIELHRWKLPFRSCSTSRSVSGKRVCSYCNNILGKGAAMIIESLGLCFHLYCFKCVACECNLGGSSSGAEVRIRNNQLFCNDCYLRFKSGRPTAMWCKPPYESTVADRRRGGCRCCRSINICCMSFSLSLFLFFKKKNNTFFFFFASLDYIRTL